MVELHAERAPDRLRRPGPGTSRVLLVGAGEALADRIADRAWLAARCGLDVDLLPDVPALEELLSGARGVRRYGAVVVVADDAIGGRAPAVLAVAAAGTELLVVGPEAPDGPWRSVRAPVGDAFGDRVAAALVELLGEQRPPAREDDVTAHLRRVAQAASGAYGAASAMVALVGPHTVRTLVSVGPRLAPEERSACALDRPADEPTVILDASTDPRTRDAVDPERLRFLAAHPVESADGRPIGMVCVFDDEPREACEVDLEVLRDLAVLAGAEIEHAVRRARPKG